MLGRPSFQVEEGLATRPGHLCLVTYMDSLRDCLLLGDDSLDDGWWRSHQRLTYTPHEGTSGMAEAGLGKNRQEPARSDMIFD